MFVGKMSVDQMSVGQTSVGQMSVDQTSVGRCMSAKWFSSKRRVTRQTNRLDLACNTSNNLRYYMVLSLKHFQSDLIESLS